MNKMRIRVVGNQIQSWLNGASMISLKDEMIGKERFNCFKFMTGVE